VQRPPGISQAGIGGVIGEALLQHLGDDLRGREDHDAEGQYQGAGDGELAPAGVWTSSAFAVTSNSSPVPLRPLAKMKIRQIGSEISQANPAGCQ
jgi:hypothetical protein